MAEWDRLPMHEQQLLREGLEAEAPWIGRSVMLEKADNPLDLKTGLFADEREDTDEGSAQDLADIGFSVRKSDKLTPVYVPAGNG